ncbi:MAG: hypothetical protein H0T87_01670 [Gammaproteobacteria bacterium]|nr:hypothetical protein [Gammaproteobacteria bacterium]
MYRKLWNLYWVIVAVASSLLAYALDWVPHEDGTILAISSGFAEYLQNLIDHGTYRSCVVKEDPCYTTTRLPFVPWVHYLLHFLVGMNLLAHLLVKNVVFYGIAALALERYARKRDIGYLAIAAIYSLVYLNPVSLRMLPTLGGEEGYYVHLLLALFLLLADTIFSVARAHLIGLLFAILALTKSILAPVCLVAAVYLLMREKCNRLAFVPAVYLLAVLGAWSWWSHETTGRWTHVANISSFDGINLYKGNNEFVEALYPEVHLDALTRAGLTEPPRDIQDKEWAINDHFRQLALRYLSSDWSHALRFLWFKTHAVFFAMTAPARITVQEPISVDQLRDLAALRDEKTLKDHVLAIGYGLYKGLFIASIALAVWDVKKGRIMVSASMSYVLLCALLSVPYVIGWAFGKHLAVLYSLMFLYVSLVFLASRAPGRSPILKR